METSSSSYLPFLLCLAEAFPEIISQLENEMFEG